MGIISSLAGRTRLVARLRTKCDELKAHGVEMKAEIAGLRRELKIANNLRGHPCEASERRAGEMRDALAELLAHDEMVRDIPGADELSTRVVLSVAEDDIMLKKSSAVHYLRTGFSALDSIYRSVPGFADRPPGAVLDFGCGYGRVLRLLRAAWPDAAITAADLMPDGLAFCMEHFDVCGFRSKIEPVRPRIAQHFDLVWAGSVVTHLPAHKVEGFMGLWRDLLEPGGHMVFTGHGGLVLGRLERGETDYGLTSEGVIAAMEGCKSRGFGYADYSGVSGYGVSVMSESWLRSMADRIGGLRFKSLLPHHWDNHQDVWCFEREA